MKNLIVIAIAFLSLQVMAQDHGRPHHKKMDKEMLKDLSAEDMATLKTKRMTLDLDLDESQSKAVYALFLEESKRLKTKMAERNNEEKKEKPSKEEHLKRLNEKLDRQIALKKEMKSILNEDQYKKYERHFARRGKQKKEMRRERRS